MCENKLKKNTYSYYPLPVQGITYLLAYNQVDSNRRAAKLSF